MRRSVLPPTSTQHAQVSPRFLHETALGCGPVSSFLRKGGNICTLQTLLGHMSLEMVKRHVAVAQADTENAHRSTSPVDS